MTRRRLFRLAAPVLAALAACPAAAAAGAPRLQPLTPRDGHVRAAPYDLDLGDADGAGRATAWSGPVRVSGGARPCTVSDDVAVVTTPIAWAAGRYAYLSTYSGSHAQVYAVDLQTCAVKWASPRFVGRARFDAESVLLPGGRRVRLAASGFPAAWSRPAWTRRLRSRSP